MMQVPFNGGTDVEMASTRIKRESAAADMRERGLTSNPIIDDETATDHYENEQHSEGVQQVCQQQRGHTYPNDDALGRTEIDAHILARSTAEQDRKRLRCALALVGVSFPNSAWYVYVLQVVGLGTQGWSLSVWIEYEDYMATNDDELDVQAQAQNLLGIFILVCPWCFLCYLTRSHERHTLNDIVKKLTMPWWICLLYTSPSPRDLSTSRMPSSA